MRAILAPIALTLALAASPASADNHDDRHVNAKGEAELAELIDGRIAGEPTNCVSTFGRQNIHVIDETALVYKQGDTLWVNRPNNPRWLDKWDVLVVKQFGSQLCRHDQVTMADRTSGITSGAIFLGDFVPYKRID